VDACRGSVQKDARNQLAPVGGIANLEHQHAIRFELDQPRPGHAVGVEGSGDHLAAQGQSLADIEGRSHVGQPSDGPRPIIDPNRHPSPVTETTVPAGNAPTAIKMGEPVAFGAIASGHPQADVLAGAWVGQQLDVGLEPEIAVGGFIEAQDGLAVGS
jgi:hypothetical protein